MGYARFAAQIELALINASICVKISINMNIIIGSYYLQAHSSLPKSLDGVRRDGIKSCLIPFVNRPH